MHMIATATKFSIRLIELEALNLRGFGKQYTGLGTVSQSGHELLDFEWTYCKRNGANILNMPTAVLQPDTVEEIKSQIREGLRDKYRGAL